MVVILLLRQQEKYTKENLTVTRMKLTTTIVKLNNKEDNR